MEIWKQPPGLCCPSKSPLLRVSVLCLLEKYTPNAHYTTCGKVSSLLPQLLTSAKLHLPFCFTDSGSENRHKLASQGNNKNQRQLSPQRYTRTGKAPLCTKHGHHFLPPSSPTRGFAWNEHCSPNLRVLHPRTLQLIILVPFQPAPTPAHHHTAG